MASEGNESAYPAPVNNRIEYDAAAGGFHVVLGGRDVVIPERTGADLVAWASAWTAGVTDLTGRRFDAEGSTASLHDRVLAAQDRHTEYSDLLLQALLDYDKGGVLGDREWIRSHLTLEQAQLLVRRFARRVDQA
jgi:hypothetical protein